MTSPGEDPPLGEAEADSCSLLRGLRANDFVLNGVVPPEIAAEAFMPEGPTRDEISVSLDDVSGVGRRRLFADHGNSRLGIAHLDRAEYESLKSKYPRIPGLVVDREPHDRHATLKYQRGLTKPQYRLVASVLAATATHIPRPPR